jgi:hypothetical protein
VCSSYSLFIIGGRWLTSLRIVIGTFSLFVHHFKVCSFRPPSHPHPKWRIFIVVDIFTRPGTIIDGRYPHHRVVTVSSRNKSDGIIGVRRQLLSYFFWPSNWLPDQGLIVLSTPWCFTLSRMEPSRGRHVPVWTCVRFLSFLWWQCDNDCFDDMCTSSK